MKNVFLVVAMVLALAGCSSPTPTPTTEPTKTQAQIEADFIKIASDSCTKAQTDDVIESVADGSKIIALAKDHGISDYSAVYVDPKGVSQIIYELDLVVCGPTYLLSMQKEANHDNSGDYEHHIKLNSDGTYTWTQHSYGNPGKLDKTIFTVVDGFITHAITPDYEYSITYGPASAEDKAILQAAVDALGN